MLSHKARYALRALVELAREPSGQATTAELALRADAPRKFLEAILLSLARHHLLTSRRGKFGGYALAKPASEIGVGQLIRLIDGRLAPICCASENAYQPCTCPDEDHCGLRMVMIDVRNAIANILDRYTIAQVVEVTLRKMRRDGIVPPFAAADAIKLKDGVVKRKADPADGFLAGLSQLATFTQESNDNHRL